MKLARALAATTVVAGVACGGSAVGLSPIASATDGPLAEGTYRFDFGGSTPYSMWFAIRSACPGDCIATATQLDPDDHTVASRSASVVTGTLTLVYREDHGRWLSIRPEGFACNGNKVVSTNSQSFTENPDGTLHGFATESAPPCEESRPFTATRVGELAPGVNPVDPATA